jgi:hypothetical protein
VAAALHKMTSQATPAASSGFVREVTSYEHEMLKALRVLEATKSESLKYDDLSSEIESEVQSMEQDLVALGQQLLQQKQVSCFPYPFSFLEAGRRQADRFKEKDITQWNKPNHTRY